VTVTADDFASVAVAEALAPRQPDGSLPDVGFMRLAAGSDVIDRGTDVGLPFVGSGPDLGAFEFGATGTRDGPDLSPGRARGSRAGCGCARASADGLANLGPFTLFALPVPAARHRRRGHRR
jgi:hypothetical protein